MIQGGNATIYVSDLGRAVAFYRDVLGMKLIFQAGPHFAKLDAGGGMLIGLHPKVEQRPAPGTHGAISVGLSVTQPMEQVVAELGKRGVKFRGPVRDDGGVKLAFFGDPDGNDLYLAETAWGKK